MGQVRRHPPRPDLTGGDPLDYDGAMNSDEPTYFVDTAHTGVGFARNPEGVPADGTILAPVQVDPDVRAEGRIWLAAQD